jgi:hypothetical protein
LPFEVLEPDEDPEPEPVEVPPEPDGDVVEPLPPFDDEAVDVAAPAGVVRTTWTVLALEADFPIRNPTPSASSSATMPASTIIVDDRPVSTGRSLTGFSPLPG